MISDAPITLSRHCCKTKSEYVSVDYMFWFSLIGFIALF